MTRKNKIIGNIIYIIAIIILVGAVVSLEIAAIVTKPTAPKYCDCGGNLETTRIIKMKSSNTNVAEDYTIYFYDCNQCGMETIFKKQG